MTQLLQTTTTGGIDELIRRAYAELRKMARAEKQRVFSGRPGLTQQTTDILHEVWEKLKAATERCSSGDHFYGTARIIIRQFLIDYARRRLAQKRGAGRRGIAIDAAVDAGASSDSDQLPLEYAELMEKFGGIEPRACEAFALCDLAGFKQKEAAELLGISLAAIERDLKFARAWWRKELSSGDRDRISDSRT